MRKEKIMKKLYTELWFQVMTAMVLGLIVGLVLSPFGLGLLSEASAEHVAPWIAMPGNLFLALIKMVVIPLVLSSIILGITSSEDINFLKKVSMRIFPYFIATTMLATSIGAGTALLIQPGQYIDSALIADVMENSSEADATVVEPVVEQHLTDRLIDLIPTNYIKSALDQDMLATVILALFIGMAMVAVAPARMKPMFEFITAVQDISMKIIEWTMKMAPVAVFALICNITLRVGIGAIVGMAAYMGSVVIGLLLLLLLYLLIVWALGKKSPLAFLKQIGGVQLLAFSTSSSAATIPLAMTTAEQRLKVDGPHRTVHYSAWCHDQYGRYGPVPGLCHGVSQPGIRRGNGPDDPGCRDHYHGGRLHRHTEYAGRRHRHPGNHSSGYRGAGVRHCPDHRRGPYS